MLKHLFLIPILLISTVISAQNMAVESDEMNPPPVHYTYHQASGNRLIEGTGTFPNVTLTEIDLDGLPDWVVGTEDGWQVTLANGQLVTIQDNAIASTQQTVASPPVIDEAGNLLPRFGQFSELTHAVALGDGNFLDIQQNGDLVHFQDGIEQSRLALNSQPDARIVLSDDGRIALYAQATNQRYIHGIMGDDFEGTSLFVLHMVNGELRIFEQMDLQGDAVFEGLSPFWADINQDGFQDLITTVSDGFVGSRIRAFITMYEGFTVVDGQAIGQSNRWQHQLAWGAFGMNGEMALVDVLTPHIGGVVRFYQFDDNQLNIVAEQRGYTSHLIGSRNLDMAVAGDFNGDGQLEIVMPSQNRSSIAGIQQTENGAEVVWEIPLGATVGTNFAARQTDNGLELAIGTENNKVIIIQSQL